MDKNQGSVVSARPYRADRDLLKYKVVATIRSDAKLEIHGILGQRHYAEWQLTALDELASLAEGVRSVLSSALSANECHELIAERFVDIGSAERTVTIGYDLLADAELSHGYEDLVLHFLSGISDLPLESDRPEGQCSDTHSEAIRVSVAAFLSVFNGKRIKYPSWISVGNRTGYLVGYYRQMASAAPINDQPMELCGRLVGLSEPRREIEVQLESGKFQRLSFDVDLYLGRLIQILCDRKLYRFQFVFVPLPKGKEMRRMLAMPILLDKAMDIFSL